MKKFNSPNLSMLEQPHILLLNVDMFWTELSISLPRNKNDRGHGFGLKWQHSEVESEYLTNYIPDLTKWISRTDWVEITFSKTKESLVILHYVTGTADLLRVRSGVLAETTLPIAKLRLMGDQIIQAASERRAKYAEKWKK